MSQFLELNLPEFNINQDPIYVGDTVNTCLCCLSQNEVMVKLLNCSHTGFLQDYLKMDFDQMYVMCTTCHSMLKKIESFKEQVDESYKILKHQLLKKPTKQLNLKQSSTIIITNLKDTEDGVKDLKEYSKEEFKEDSKEEELKEESAFDMMTDVKVEHDSSDFENELPLSQIKKIKKAPKVKGLGENFEGKIKLVLLEREEMMEERERESKKESYLKLPFKCETCIKGYDHEITLKSHMEKQHSQKEGGFTCDVCKSVLGNEATFKEHYRRHVRRYECLACGKRTNDKYSVAQHYNQQHGDNEGIAMQFACKLCDFTTDSYRSYRYHKGKHKPKYPCDLCGNTFRSGTGLRIHKYTVHKQSKQSYTCTICNKSYKCKSGLHNHAAAHGARASYCALCRTHFATKTGLAHHLRTHSAHVTDDLKKFACNKCDAKFLTKPALQSHIDWEHLKKFHYKCNKCNKVFKGAVFLKRHNNFVHEKKRPPKDKICDYCGRAFTTNAILASHIRTHTGERPLHCAHCPATFAHKGALYTHCKLLHQ